MAAGTVQSVPFEDGASATVVPAPTLTRAETNSYLLNLSIPYGPTGVSPTLTIGEVQTLPAGQDATATIDAGTEENTYEINLGIPNGVGLAAYGGLYSNSNNPISTTADVASQIDLPSVMPNSNLTTNNNEIVISEAGSYEITYSVVLTPTLASTIQVYAQDNGVEIAESNITIALTAGQNIILNKNIITNIYTNSNIDLVIESNQTDTVNVTSCALTIKKLDSIN